MSQRGDDYLKLPDSAAATGGLRWATGFDAIVDGDGNTVVLFEELEAILGGVFSISPVPTFLSVLLVLHPLRRETVPPLFVPLRDAYRRNKTAESVARHLGRLIAEACMPLPPALNPPDWKELQLALYRLWGEGQTPQPNDAVLPDHTPEEFAEFVGQLLQKLTPDLLDHYLKFGDPPTGAGEKIAAEVDDIPGTVARVLALARKRPRLVGTALLAPEFDAAMTLPARSRAAESLPMGGYADVTTRGDPDRLLLSQFALDPDEFVRRFAERELLYFQREEPHTPVPPERVIVLDQGVRTWGGIRLALAAAALALLKQNPKQSPVPRLFPTSRGKGVPVSSPEELAKVLEASDLTANPSDLLSDVCCEPDSGTPRDILLLTHPRSAAEPDIIAAAKGRHATDRLFVLAVNDDGAAVLSEWTARGPVTVRSFRVDLVAAENALPEQNAAPAKPAGPSVDYKPWTGDVEPVPFPFRPGLLDQPEQMGFDASGEWLVIVTRSGIPHALVVGDDKLEVLPRAMRDGAVLKQVVAVLAVNGGVVLCGTMTLGKQQPDESTGRNAYSITSGAIAAESSATVPETEAHTLPGHFHVAAHYDSGTRIAKLFVFDSVSELPDWQAYPELHSVVLRKGSKRCPLSLDLGSSRNGYPFDMTERMFHARARSNSIENRLCDPKPVQIMTDFARLNRDDPFLTIVQNAFRVQLPQRWELFEPTEDGKPLLAGAILQSALLARDILALAITKAKTAELRLYRGPDPTALGVVPLDNHTRLFTLSPDGRKLAWMRGKLEVAIAETERLSRVVEKFHHAGLHGQFEVSLGKGESFWLWITIGSYQHRFLVEGHTFSHSLHREPKAVNTKNNTVREKSDPKEIYRLPPGFDPTRFSVIDGSDPQGLRVIADRQGQIFVLDRSDELLVMFLIRRDKAAAWSPKSGFWGNADLIGGSPTANADKRIGELIDAEWGKR